MWHGMAHRTRAASFDSLLQMSAQLKPARYPAREPLYSRAMAARVKAGFVEPMLLLRTENLPPDPERWEYQLKFDGYRAIAFKTGGTVHLRSRNDNDFTRRYPAVASGLADMPDETVIDGEIVALDDDGRPSFNALQNFSPGTPVVYYVFDVMVLDGRNVMSESLETRRALLERKVLPALAEPVRYPGALNASLRDLIHSVKAQGLEGLVAKRRDSKYEPGLRSGAWMKMRVNRGQEFVIGGYTVGTKTFDALVIGYYEGDRLIYAARTRNGFTPATREQLFKRFAQLGTRDCMFANLPEAKSGRWGEGLTRAKMAECRWLKPVLVGQFEFVEWTPDNHLRHSRFVALRDDKSARDVRRE
jgi:DNA ligase D-like protein (predicted ligase)